MEDVFKIETVQNYVDRISKLESSSQRKWGSMSVEQMLAHCNVSYELVYESEKHKAMSGIAKFFLKYFVKSKIVNEIPYRQNLPTASSFKIKEIKNFEEERGRLIQFLEKTQSDGRSFFEGKESSSFGKLSATEWNNMFAKHLNHHLTQFDV